MQVAQRWIVAARRRDVLKAENGEDLLPLFRELTERVCRAAHAGEPVHAVEKSIWQEILRIGRKALSQFFALVGSGDMGESITLPGGRSCQRLEELHERRYVSIFGEFALQRTVYGSREGQKIEFVPVDNRLQLPESVFSYVLQDWDQSFCVEQAFGPVPKPSRASWVCGNRWTAWSVWGSVQAPRTFGMPRNLPGHRPQEASPIVQKCWTRTRHTSRSSRAWSQ